jgi:hypothetical protein
MRHFTLPFTAVAVATAATLVASPARAQEQPPAVTARTPARVAQRPLTPPPPDAPTVVSGASAYETYNQLERILTRYPPSVRRVLRTDPSLLGSTDYLAPYPELSAFLQQHPEVARNPTFFLGRSEEENQQNDPKVAAMRTLENGLDAVLVFAGIMLALWMVVALLRQVVDYRRWLRQSRVQAEASTKVLDRLGSNDDLLAYLQTPAGMSLVQAAPAIESPRAIGIPVSRILWSVQAGVVLAALGVGLWLVKGSVIDEIAPAFAVAGTVAVCVGVGFIVSAGIAWLISSRLDLFAPKSS